MHPLIALVDANGSPIQKAGRVTEDTLDTQDTYLPWLEVRGYFNVSIQDMEEGDTVVLARSFGSGNIETARVVQSFTTDIETFGFEPEPNVYYTLYLSVLSGSGPTLRISQ